MRNYFSILLFERINFVAEWQNPPLSQSGRDSVPSSAAGSSSGVSMQQQQRGPSTGSNAGGRHDGSGQQGKTADYKSKTDYSLKMFLRLIS